MKLILDALKLRIAEVGEFENKEINDCAKKLKLRMTGTHKAEKMQNFCEKVKQD